MFNYINFANTDIEIIDGDRSKNYPKKSDFSQSGYCLFLSATNVTKDGFKFASCEFISKEKDLQLRKGRVQKHDVILTTRGTIGNVALVDSNVPFENLRINSGMLILRANPKSISPHFLYYYLRSKIFQERMRSVQSGAAQPQLPISTLLTLDMLMPPILVQNEIAKVITALDDLIRTNLRKIETLEKTAILLYKEWFVNFKFPGHEKIEMIDSGHPDYDMVPNGWSVCKVGDILSSNPKSEKLKTTDYLQSGKYPVVDQGQDFIAGYTNNLSAVISEAYPIIVFGDHTRALKLINFPFARGADGTQLIISSKKEMPQHLFYQSLKYLDLSNHHYARHFKFLKDSAILIPTEEIAVKYESIAVKIYPLIYNLRLQNNSLSKIRDLLLPKLISGEIDVSKVSEFNIENLTSKKPDITSSERNRL